MLPRARPAPSSARGFVLSFPFLLLTAAVLSVVLALLMRPASQPSVAGLKRFLHDGPTTGMWESKRLYTLRRAYFAPLPGSEERILMAPVPGSETKTGCKTCRSVCSYTRAQVMQFFFEPPPDLFFRNYKLIKRPEPAKLPDGRGAYVAVWGPRFRDGASSEREVWFDEKTGEVLQVEDFSRSGHLIRRARKVKDDTGEFDPRDFDPVKGDVCHSECPSERLPEAQQLQDVAEESGLQILRPRQLPKGFELVRATYREVELPQPGREDEGDERIARLVTLLYSDGMALISIGIAPAPDMDALERASAAMRMKAAEDGESEGTCPTLKAKPKRIPVRGTTIRVRTDTCRTVLRRDDDVGGLAITLLGRGELAVDEYLDVLAELEPFVPAPAPETD